MIKKAIKVTFLMFVVFFTSNLFSQQTKPYNDKINAVEQINKAIEQANKENKYVLCQVGGNWCPWCLIFAELATTNK